MIDTWKNNVVGAVGCVEVDGAVTEAGLASSVVHVSVCVRSRPSHPPD